MGYYTHGHSLDEFVAGTELSWMGWFPLPHGNGWVGCCLLRWVGLGFLS